MRKGRLDRCAEARVVVDLVAVLAVWWEHLPIEVVLQMLGGRCRNRGGVLVSRPFKSVDQGQPVSETVEVSQCQPLCCNQLTCRSGGWALGRRSCRPTLAV